jgi:hypothetical protein
MDIEKILSGLKADRVRLDQAIAALEGTGSQEVVRTKRAYTKRAVVAAPQPRAMKPDKGGADKGGGGITAAGRKRLSEMMKKRWADRRKKKGS